MTRKREPFPKSVRRLWIRLTSVWTLTWLSGLLIFGVTTSLLAIRYYNQQIDSRLRIQAIAVYGLAFFNEDGEFESDLLDYEDELFERDTGLWIIEPANQPIVHLSDGDRLSESTLNAIAGKVVNSGTDFRKSGTDRNGNPYRLLAIPTYDVDSMDPKAAIIVVTNPTASNTAMQRLLWRSSLLFAGLGLLGVVVGGIIAHWSLKPLARYISDREKFLSAAAHELRTPLAAIKAVVEAGVVETEQPTVSLGRLGPLVAKATDCMEDLLLYARLDADRELINKEPIRLDLLVEKCLPEECEIKFDLEETIVQGDERLLQALIRNLLANSLRHATSPAKVSISLSNNVLMFQNDGEGFPEEVIAQSKGNLRVASSKTGSGFGLALVQMIMKLHKGEFILRNSKTGLAIAETVFKRTSEYR